MTVQILPFDPHTAPDRDVAAWVDVYNAAQAVDLPDDPLIRVDRLRDHLGSAKPERIESYWTARVDGAIVAILEAELYLGSNAHLGGLSPIVHPGHRRRGIGTALVELATEFVGRTGRRTIVGEVAEGTAAIPFADALGFDRALAERCSVQRFDEVDWDRLQVLAEQPHPPYRLVLAHKALPDELLAPYAVAKGAMNDAPTGDLDWNDDVYTAERIEKTFRSTSGEGAPLYVACAVLDTPEGPEVAGLTEMQVQPWRPTRAEQWDTCVVPAHRGHGLGLWIKAALTRWVHEEHPDIVDASTWNAESNAHMLAVNTALGYRPDRTWYEYQRPVTSADADAPATSVTAGIE